MKQVNERAAHKSCQLFNEKPHRRLKLRYQYSDYETLSLSLIEQHKTFVEGSSIITVSVNVSVTATTPSSTHWQALCRTIIQPVEITQQIYAWFADLLICKGLKARSVFLESRNPRSRQGSFCVIGDNLIKHLLISYRQLLLWDSNILLNAPWGINSAVKAPSGNVHTLPRLLFCSHDCDDRIWGRHRWVC